MRRIRHAAAPLGILLLVACQPSLSVPSKAVLECGPHDTCPSGYFCSPTLGRCITSTCAASVDAGVPCDGLPLDVVGAPVWTPAAGGAGTVFQVTFQASKTLGIDPGVRLKAPKDGSERLLSKISVSNLTYVYAYRATGDEGSGTATALIDLTDSFGETAASLPLGSVQFDFSSPSIASGATLTPAVASVGTKVDIRFKAVSPAGATPVTVLAVHVGSSPATAASPQPTDGSSEYAYTVPAGITEGATPVTTDIKDASGNVAMAVPLGTLQVDTTAPALQGTPEISDPETHAGAAITVTVTLTEPLAQPPVLEIRAGQPFTCTMLSAVQYEFGYVVQTADVGTQTLTLSQVVDVAGNAAAPITVGTIDVSDTAPALASTPTLTPGTQWMTVGAAVAVTFTTAGPVGAPVVAISLANGHSIPMAQTSVESAGSSGGSTYTFSHTITATDSQGTGSVTISLLDAYGNTAGPFSVGWFTIDTTPPTAAAGIQISPTPPAGVGVGIGQLLVVTVSANETLSDAAITTTPTALTFTRTLSGTAAIWSHTVTSTDASGSYQISATITDLAGNMASIPSASVLLDTSEPSVGTSGTVSFEYATVGTTLTATFDSSEPLGSDPIVVLGAQAGAPAFVKDATGSSGQHYVYTHSVVASDLTGSQPAALPVTAFLTNRAGNSVPALLGEVNLDFSLITSQDVTSAPNPATVGSTLVVTAQASRTISSAQSLVVLAPTGLTFGTPTVLGSTATWSTVVPANSTGPINIVVTLEDASGHSFTFEVDNVGVISG